MKSAAAPPIILPLVYNCPLTLKIFWGNGISFYNLVRNDIFLFTDTFDSDELQALQKAVQQFEELKYMLQNLEDYVIEMSPSNNSKKGYVPIFENNLLKEWL